MAYSHPVARIPRDQDLDECIRHIDRALAAIDTVRPGDAPRGTSATAKILDTWLRQRIERHIRGTLSGDVAMDQLLGAIAAYREEALANVD
ncbi:MAG: hypothetical protein KDK12_03945 [Rhodobacteraceae bacterium]|nr:hypothetical protein [Paracoccaceae bacterium]